MSPRSIILVILIIAALRVMGKEMANTLLLICRFLSIIMVMKKTLLIN